MKNQFVLSLFVFFGCLSSAVAVNPAPVQLPFYNAQITAMASWNTTLAVGTSQTLSLEFEDSNGNAVAPEAEIKVQLSMPEMGHNTAAKVAVPNLDSNNKNILGSYRVENLKFSMEGHWVLTVTLKSANGSKESQSFDIQL